jgi:ribosomal protein L37AE/L43A
VDPDALECSREPTLNTNPSRHYHPAEKIERVTIFRFKEAYGLCFQPDMKSETKMRKTGEWACRFCLKTFTGSAIGRHLETCKAKKEKDVEEVKEKRPQKIFHIKVSGGGEYLVTVERT